MKELRGRLRQKEKHGNFYYRLTLPGGLRKEFALKTTDEKEAIQKAANLDAVYEAPNQDVAFAQINAIKGFSRRASMLSFSEGWVKYEAHPERAIPHTVSEQLSYKKTYEDFVAFVTSPQRAIPLTFIADISSEIVAEFADFMRQQAQAVDTHNRKIKRLRKIFDCLKDYYSGENPFKAKTLLRNYREEQDTVIRRLPFSKEQEQQLRDVLADDKFKVINKPEIRVIYYLGMYTGQRLKDCVLLQWQNIDMEHQRIWVKQFKTGKEVRIPMAKELFEVLQEAAGWKINQYVCPKSAERYNKKDARGKNVGNNLVNKDILRAVSWIGLEPSVEVPGRKKKMTVYGFHSLRHSFASFGAAAGVPKAVMESIWGASSEIVDKYYTHIGDDAQRQAIEAISDETNQNSLAERIQKVIALIDSNPEPTRQILNEIRNILTDK